MRALLGVPVYLGLIATPDETRGWDAPNLHAWVVREQCPGRDVCEAAALV